MFEISAAMWALTDDRAGHNAHTLGLADALGLEYTPIKLRFNVLSHVPAALQPSGFSSLTEESRAALHAPWPSLVIASGKRMIPVMRAIKQHSAKTKLVQCLWPRQIDPFDVVVAPWHDAAIPDHPRIVRYHGALHQLKLGMLKHAALSFHALFEPLPRPHIGVLIGGHSKHAKASLANLHHLLDTAELLAGGGSLFLTTSRRTPASFVNAIRERLTCPFHLHAWGSDDPNPYHAMLARCDALIVSGDSVSMIAEACASGKPVLIDTQFASMRTKHRRAAEHLIAAGHAAQLRADISLESLAQTPLNEMPRVAKDVKALLHL